VSRDFIEPVRSSVPVLMFSGGVDGSTPSWLGSDAVRYLSHGRQIYARYAGHQLDNECVGPLIDAFIASARADGIDASCAARIRRPSFATELPFKSP
jgi:hypothetical protein